MKALYMSFVTNGLRVGEHQPDAQKASRLASVTTKDGIPTTATQNPWNRPTNPANDHRRKTPTSRITTVGACGTHSLMISADAAPVMPTWEPSDRSISPSSRTTTTPMAAIPYIEVYTQMLVIFAGEVNSSGLDVEGYPHDDHPQNKGNRPAT